MAFDEEQFPTDISKNSKVRIMTNTTVVRTKMAAEQRNGNWNDPLWMFDVRYGIKRQETLQTLQVFYIARRGRRHGFRFKNPIDFMAVNQPVGPLETVSSVTTVQLLRRYISGPRSYDKNIVKPIAPITMRESASSFAGFTLNSTTGIVTLTAFAATVSYDSYTTSSNPTEFTTPVAHGLAVDDQIIVNGSDGGTLDGPQAVSAVGDATHFSIAVLGPAVSAAGTIDVPYQLPNFPGSFDWSGEFDLPVAFLVDKFKPIIEGFNAGNVPSIPIEETRDFL